MSFPNSPEISAPQVGRPCKYGHNSGRDKTRHCLECKRLREAARYRSDPAAVMQRRALRPVPPSQTPEGRRSWSRNNPEKIMLHMARSRARGEGYLCTITTMDISIPEYCPLLGLRLEQGTEKRTDASPSLDKIRPELGYVPGNVWVISWKANRIKNNATLQELQMIVAKLTERML